MIQDLHGVLLLVVLNYKLKKVKNLHITNESDWKEEDNVIGEVVGAKINEYNAHLNKSIPLTSRTTNELLPISFVQFHHGEQCTDSGYQIQKTEPGDGYVWHNDFAVQQPFGIRVLTFIFYLNTVDEGWTQFYNGNQISPKAGRLDFSQLLGLTYIKAIHQNKLNI